MKRALSLIIVLAMVLCMIPFSAFAAPEWNVGGTDFIDGGNYALLEENNYMIEELLWIAEESGTLKGVNFTPYVEEVAEGAEGEDYSDVPVFADVEGVDVTEEGFEGYPVIAGMGYQISLYTNDQDWKGTAVIDFVGEPGSQTNPYVIINPEAASEEDVVINEVTVPAGETVFCELRYFTGATVRVEGEGVKVTMNEVEYGENGVAEFQLGSNDRSVGVQLTNTTEQEQTYSIAKVVKVIPVGTEENPKEVVAGTYTAELKAGATPYFYKYIAEGNGTVKVSVNAADAEGNAIGWQYQVENKSVEVGGMGDTHWFDDEPVVNTETIAVTEGDEIVIWVNTYAPNDALGNMQQTPAGNVTTTIEFVAEGSEEPAPTGLVLGDNAGITGGEYTYTATEAGNLTVSVTGMILNGNDDTMGLYYPQYFSNFAFSVNGVPSYTNIAEAIAVEVGDVVTVSLTYAQLTPAEFSAVLTLTMGEGGEGGDVEAEEGTMDNPIVITELNWSVENTGSFDKYYSYTATGDAIIKVSSTAGELAVQSDKYENVKTYDSNTIYVVVAEGDTIIINTWASVDTTCSAEFVDALPEANGTSAFPYEIVDLPFEATNSDPDYSMFYTYTATNAVDLLFSGDLYSLGIEVNGMWAELSEEGLLSVAAGDVVSICLYAGASFEVATPVVVAQIDDVPYYSIAAAVAAAVNGDEIVLVTDAVSETGITLFAGVTLNLNGKVLTAPYIAALNGNFVVGAAGATINTTNMMAAELINIDGVDYEWVAGDGVYTLTSVVKPVANPVAKIGDTPYATVEDALNAAKSGDVVVMIADSVEKDATLLIKGGVTLDIATYDLTVLNILGLNTGYIKGSTYSNVENADYGRIFVDPNNISIGISAPAGTSNGYKLIPIYYNNCFILSQVKLNVTIKRYENEGNSYYWEFGFNMTGSVKSDIITDGTSDNELDIAVVGSWSTDAADLSQTFVYNDKFVNIFCTQNKTLSGSIGGLLSKKDVAIDVMFMTNSGVVVSVPILKVVSG